MEIAGIARTDFMRIPHEFVHPSIEMYQRMSFGLVLDVMETISFNHNIVANADGFFEEMDELEAAMRSYLPGARARVHDDTAYMRRQMNYVKAEIFPMMEFIMRYFRTDVDALIASLEFCN